MGKYPLTFKKHMTTIPFIVKKNARSRVGQKLQENKAAHVKNGDSK